MKFDFRTELGKMTPLIAQGAKIYIFGCGQHYEYLRRLFAYLADVELDDCVDGFIDNDPAKQHRPFHGKTVLPLEEVDLQNAVILIAAASPKAGDEIAMQLTEHGLLRLNSFFAVSSFLIMLMRWEYNALAQYKDLHKGERCFIIGNGPSLTPEDLDKLKGEVCFAANRIYLLFNRTQWRPTYFVISDAKFLALCHREIREAVSCPIFYAYPAALDIEDFALRGEHFYSLDGTADWYPNEHLKVGFSEAPFILNWGATVTYDSMQLAAYMGFREIYLLGMDHMMSNVLYRDGRIVSTGGQDHFLKEYNLKEVYYNGYMGIDLIECAYRTAKRYFEEHGGHIYNATRGGKLEIFDRVDFDSLF